MVHDHWDLGYLIMNRKQDMGKKAFKVSSSSTSMCLNMRDAPITSTCMIKHRHIHSEEGAVCARLCQPFVVPFSIAYLA